MRQPSSLIALLLPVAIQLAQPSILPAQSIFDSLRVAARTELYFDFGQDQIRPDAAALLDSFARTWAALESAHSVRITAHTDSVGSLANNLALSERRAGAVRQALAERGIPAGNIALRYFGEVRPAATNSTETGRQHNRRATLEALTSIPMAPFSGQVQDEKTGAGIPAVVHFSTRTLRDSAATDPEGFFSVHLPQDSVVKTETYAQGYFFGAAMQRMYGTPEMLERMRKQPPVLTLRPAQAGEKAILEHLFFVGNQAVLLKTSEPELPKVLRFMQVNPNLRVEVAGHINNPIKASGALDDWEWELSVNRAKLVYDYLLKNGIAAARMTYKGYGNTEMLFPNQGATEAQQEQNRRVEIRVLEAAANGTKNEQN